MQLTFTTAFACLLSALTVAAAPAGTDPVIVTFDDKGLASVVHNGEEIIGVGSGRPIVHQVTFIPNAPISGAIEPRNIFLPSPTRSSFQPTTKTATTLYAWGRMDCRYVVAGNRLDLFIKLVNDSQETIASAELFLARVQLPNTHDNVEADARLAGRLLKHHKGSVAMMSWETAKPVDLRLLARGTDGLAGTPLAIRVRPEVRPDHPIVDDQWFYDPGRPIRAKSSDEYRISLAFGPTGATVDELCRDLHQHIARELPMTLQWPDRRPIGMLFLCNPATGWKTNPRGYFPQLQQRLDVTTQAGLRQFGEVLLEKADQAIGNLRKMNAQGVIVWDIEGQEMPHMITYIGDPRHIDEISPEMDRFSDAYMKRFIDAGFRTGITIRPTEVFNREAGKAAWWHRDVADPVALMSEKIVYARKRWGCTLFYLDSNVFGTAFDSKVTDRRVPWTMPTRMIQRLHELHPDCLIIPEWRNVDYYRFSAPYNSPHLRQLGTERIAREIWPTAFGCVAVAAETVEEFWDQYEQSVAGGDVLMFNAGYASPESPLLRLIYQSVERSRHGTTTPPATLGTSQVRQMLASADPLTRKDALTWIARHQTDADAQLAEQLFTMLKVRNDPAGQALRVFVADALGSIGPAAVPQLLDILEDKDPALWRYAIRALGKTRTQDAKAAAILITFLTDASPRRAALAEVATAALGDLRVREAVPVLLDILNRKDRDGEPLRAAAVIALGKIADRRAIQPLIEHHRRNYSTVVVYRIHRDLDEALTSITGERELLGPEQWEHWWRLQKP